MSIANEPAETPLTAEEAFKSPLHYERRVVDGAERFLIFDRSGNEIGMAHSEMWARTFTASPLLYAATVFYVAVCGNTCHAMTRETAQELYDRGTAAIDAALVTD